MPPLLLYDLIWPTRTVLLLLLLLAGNGVESVGGSSGIVDELKIKCHREYPDVCVGSTSTQTASSSGGACNSTTNTSSASVNKAALEGEEESSCPPPDHVVSYTWEFIAGYTEEDNDVFGWNEELFKEASVGVEVYASVNHDQNQCRVWVRNAINAAYRKECDCTVCDLNQGTLSVDCTRIEYGEAVQCQSIDPFLYPLQPGVIHAMKKMTSNETAEVLGTDASTSAGSTIYVLSGVYWYALVAFTTAVTSRSCFS